MVFVFASIANSTGKQCLICEFDRYKETIIICEGGTVEVYVDVGWFLVDGVMRLAFKPLLIDHIFNLVVTFSRFVICNLVLIDSNHDNEIYHTLFNWTRLFIK